MSLYTPPAMLRELASKIPAARTAVIKEAGHSAFWERPDVFNDLVLDFIQNPLAALMIRHRDASGSTILTTN